MGARTRVRTRMRLGECTASNLPTILTFVVWKLLARPSLPIGLLCISLGTFSDLLFIHTVGKDHVLKQPHWLHCQLNQHLKPLLEIWVIT